MWKRRGARGVTRAPGHAGAVALAALWALALPGCGRGEPTPVDDPSKLTVALTSPAFADGGMIPRAFTCDGNGTSPPLEWSGVPRSAKDLVLLVEDPDAPMGTFSHWVVVNLPPGLRGLKAALPAGGIVPAASMVAADDADLKSVARQGKNDFGELGYGGPCPPSGTHHYVFRLYALDASIKLDTDSPTRSDVLRAIKGHISAEGRLIGRYARSR
jgi:Raf kinase inhibitor-like YbhB/YbcL family protein